MDAKELRIGNNIFNGVITEIGSDYFKFNDGYSTWNSRDMVEGAIEPIPITEDWLIKLGVTYSEGLRMHRIDKCFETCEPDDYEDSVYHHVYFYHNGDCFGFEVSNEWGENGNLMMSKIKYIHQLQNLFFALTGEELTITQ